MDWDGCNYADRVRQHFSSSPFKCSYKECQKSSLGVLCWFFYQCLSIMISCICLFLSRSRLATVAITACDSRHYRMQERKPFGRSASISWTSSRQEEIQKKFRKIPRDSRDFHNETLDFIVIEFRRSTFPWKIPDFSLRTCSSFFSYNMLVLAPCVSRYTGRPGSLCCRCGRRFRSRVGWRSWRSRENRWELWDTCMTRRLHLTSAFLVDLSTRDLRGRRKHFQN